MMTAVRGAKRGGNGHDAGTARAELDCVCGGRSGSFGGGDDAAIPGVFAGDHHWGGADGVGGRAGAGAMAWPKGGLGGGIGGDPARSFALHFDR